MHCRLLEFLPVRFCFCWQDSSGRDLRIIVGLPDVLPAFHWPSYLVATIVLMIAVPVFIFCLFEWALKIPLPKAGTEPWFYPIYDLMYS